MKFYGGVQGGEKIVIKFWWEQDHEPALAEIVAVRVVCLVYRVYSECAFEITKIFM